MRSVGWEGYWKLLGSCGSVFISGEHGEGGREGSHSECSVVLPLGLFHQNLHKYDIVELQLDVCLSEGPTFKRQGQVGRCEGGADRLKISASHSRQVGGVNSKNRFHYHFHAVEAAFCLLKGVASILAGGN